MADETPLRSAAGTNQELPPDAAAAPQKKDTPPARQKRRRTLFIFGAVVLILTAGVLLWRYLGRYESTDDAQGDVHLYPVSARISGYVVRVNVGDNQWVKKGDVLVEIDPTDYEVSLKQAQANLANAEATAQSLNITVPITSVNTTSQLSFTGSGVDDARAGVAAAEKQLAAAHDQLAAAEANDVNAQDNLHRYKLLVDKREVSQQIYDQALAAAKSSTATVAAAPRQRVGSRAIRPASAQPTHPSRRQSSIRADRSTASVFDARSRAGCHCRCRSRSAHCWSRRS